MKTLTATLVFFLMSLFFCQANAQISIDSISTKTEGIQQLKTKKEKVRTTEKAKLKEEVKAINQQLENGEITFSEAEKLKKEAAKKRAMNIEDQWNIIDSKIALLERNNEKDYRVSIGIFGSNDKENERIDSIPKRTVSGLTLAFGLNNAIIDGQSLNDSPYKIGGSRFFEIGYEFTTSLTDFMRAKYGISFQFNGLKPENNYYFVEQNGQTVLEEYSKPLEKSKFRNDNLVIPVHFEFGPSEVAQNGNKAYYSIENQFKFGVGGYLGLNLNTVQKLKFDENGDTEKIKLKNAYNTSNFVYGLSAYIGYDWYSLYLKYDLNPIFTDNIIEENNISFGVRLAF